MIGVGFSTAKAALEKLPGWEPESWAYHGDDGKSFCCALTGKPYGPMFTAEDVIGCGINFKNGTAFFTKNGSFLGEF
jgi:Ran-binding protein 9/10